MGVLFVSFCLFFFFFRSVGDNQRSEGRLSAAQRSFRRIGTQSLLVGTQYAGKEFVLPNSLKEERGTRNAERSGSFLSGGSIAPSEAESSLLFIWCQILFLRAKNEKIPSDPPPPP